MKSRKEIIFAFKKIPVKTYLRWGLIIFSTIILAQAWIVLGQAFAMNFSRSIVPLDSLTKMVGQLMNTQIFFIYSAMGMLISLLLFRAHSISRLA